MAVVPTDAEIRTEVLDDIRHDSRLDGANVGVDVADGTVRLTGTVPTYFQKITAEHDALRIKGVREVVNNLSVSLGAPAPDLEIARVVRANLARDRRIANPAMIDVSVDRGVVTLNGVVRNCSERLVALDDARVVSGVIDVVNNLAITPTQTRTDEEITADVRAALTVDPSVDASKIGVDVSGGTVYLRGAVSTSYEAQRAVHDAWCAGGVRNVVDELVITL